MMPTFIIFIFCSSFAVHYIVHHVWLKKFILLRAALIALTLLSLGWNFYFYAHLAKWGENPNSLWNSQYNNYNFTNIYHCNEFLANPNKRDNREIENFCHLILQKLPPKAEYWDDDSKMFYQLETYYQQVNRQRPDINIRMINSWGFEGWGADKKEFTLRLSKAFNSGKDFFIVSTGYPFNNYLANVPNKEKYTFRKFFLDDSRWIYKLVTNQERNSQEKTMWDRWDILPTDKPFIIDLSMDNVLNFNEGTALFQENMSNFGPFWKNDDQIFFSPEKLGAQIGFLLRFDQTFEADITLNCTTSYDYGIVEILLNNRTLTAEPIDLYSTNIYFKKIKFEHIHFENGNNILSFKVVGKNDASIAMKTGIDSIEITNNTRQK
ncbi:MAG: hypothetical protein HQL22_11910 [Candidatus Omnitrophica bacterium]|nr:hypothetical protein [Candidatus Omnitrophota bacterium]